MTSVTCLLLFMRTYWHLTHTSPHAHLAYAVITAPCWLLRAPTCIYMHRGIRMDKISLNSHTDCDNCMSLCCPTRTYMHTQASRYAFPILAYTQ